MSALPKDAEQRFGAVERELGPAAAALYDSIGSATDADQFEQLARSLWRSYGAGDIADDEATFLGSYIDRRRPRPRSWANAALDHRWSSSSGGCRSSAPPVSSSASGGCVILRFPKRKPQRAPDRQKAYERRHRLAYSGVMPPHLAARFTIGMMACFRVVADDHKAKGYCDASLAEIAARAGVCRKTAKRAIEAAGRWGDCLLKSKQRPRDGRKHLTNLVTIVSKEWLAWLARRSAVVAVSTANQERGDHKKFDGAARGAVPKLEVMKLNKENQEPNLALDQQTQPQPTANAAATCGHIGGHLVAPTDKSLVDDRLLGGEKNETRAPAKLSAVTHSSAPGESESGHPIGNGATPCAQATVTPEATRLAAQVAVLAGHRLRDLPRSWTDANPELVAQGWLNTTDFSPKTLLLLCAAVRQRKAGGPPFSPRYFTREILKQAEELRRPVPLPTRRA